MGALLALDTTIILYLNQLTLSSGFLLLTGRFFAIGAIFFIVGFFALAHFMNFSFMSSPPRNLLIEGLGIGLVVWLFNQLVSLFYLRVRPYRALEQVQSVIGSPLTDKSFPSDHAAIAFAFAVLLTVWEPRIGVWFLGIAALVAVARVMVGVHYPSDVLAGALIGCVFAFTLHKFFS